MELQQKYHTYLDYKGYQIDEKTYRVSPAPLMGTKFSTGRSAYSGMDFWQVGAVTDFIHGMNQKFLVEPSMCMYSEGLDLSKPGQLQLEKDMTTFTPPAGLANVTSHYRSLTKLYIGDANGQIFSTSDGLTFALEQDTGSTAVTCFYEIDNKLFAATGSGTIWAKATGGSWTQTATSTEFPALADDFTAGTSRLVYGSYKTYMTFKVPMGGTTFHTLKLKLNAVFGTPEADLSVSIYEESTVTKGTPGTAALATFTFAKGSVIATDTWMSNTITEFSLSAGVKYFLVASSAGTSFGKAWNWNFKDNSSYEFGNSGYWDGSAWTDCPYQDQFFRLERDTISNLYYVMVDSDYAFGWFNDGVRRSIDGFNWTPEPPDPLWVLPNGEGTVLNAVSTPRGYITGSQRGLWAFIGGSSGQNLWHFPDYTSSNNFKGMDRWGHLAIFSVENQGLYYTDGSQILPTTVTYLEEGFKFKSCKCIYTSGWDVYAVVSNDGSNWYLVRSNMNYNPAPKYWWVVKKLSKTPVHMAGWNDAKVYLFYSDNTMEYFDKTGTKYVTTGYMDTSIIDENLVKILKLYYNLGLIYDAFPAHTTTSIGYRLNALGSYTSKTFTGDGTTVENIFPLTNPTLGNKIQIRITLNQDSGYTAITPVVTDITWKYILQKPSEDTIIKNAYSFIILPQDNIENSLGDTQELWRDYPRKRLDYITDLRATAAKKQVLNFIGADNKSEVGITAKYTGAATSCVMTIDRTNYTITTVATGVPADSHTYDYKDKTITQVAAAIGAWSNYTATVHADQVSTRTAHDLEPRNDIELLGEQLLMVGSDVHAVILSDQSPSQQKMFLDGRGEDRITISLREV